MKKSPERLKRPLHQSEKLYYWQALLSLFHPPAKINQNDGRNSRIIELKTVKSFFLICVMPVSKQQQQGNSLYNPGRYFLGCDHYEFFSKHLACLPIY